MRTQSFLLLRTVHKKDTLPRMGTTTATRHTATFGRAVRAAVYIPGKGHTRSSRKLLPGTKHVLLWDDLPWATNTKHPRKKDRWANITHPVAQQSHFHASIVSHRGATLRNAPSRLKVASCKRFFLREQRRHSHLRFSILFHREQTYYVHNVS